MLVARADRNQLLSRERYLYETLKRLSQSPSFVPLRISSGGNARVKRRKGIYPSCLVPGS
jgi:hypothetical protein